MKRLWIPQTVATCMLLGALNPDSPYGYYVLLRWVCCGVFAFAAVRAAARDQQGWVWILGITAAIYNPIFRVHLTRTMWPVVNIVTIVIALTSIFTLKVEKQSQPTPKPPPPPPQEEGR
jgi:heme/copper-type cytochrome/quinol oxidase subunit 2